VTAGAALVAACSSTKPGEVAKDGSVTVKHIFGQTKIPAPPKRVVSAGFTEQDDLLAAVFGGTVSAEHREHVTDWWSEGMGGPAIYTEQRLRFVTLLSRAADEADLPGDPEFRAAIMGYAEWGTRLAQHNSEPGATVDEHAPVPRWGWGAAPPYQP